MPMTTRTFGSALDYVDPNVRAYWWSAAENIQPTYTEIFDEQPIKEAWREDKMLVGFGPAQATGELRALDAYDTLMEGPSSFYQLAKYHKGFAVSEEAQQFNTSFDLLRTGTRLLRIVYVNSKDTVAADLFNQGFLDQASGGYTMGDGKSLFATDHPLVRGGTYANRPAVDTDISETALEQAVIDISNFPDDAGNFHNTEADRLLLPNSKSQFEAIRILKSMARSGTADNDVNALKAQGILQKDPVIWKYLTNSRQWTILNRSFDGPGFKAYRHTAMNETPKSWVEKDGTTLVRSRWFFVVGNSNPRAGYSCPGSSGL